VSLDAAIARIKDSGVGSFELACRDLYEHVLAGRMKSGVRHVASERSSETRGILRPEFWRGVEIVPWRSRNPAPGQVRATNEGQPLAGGSWYFFVRRADLNKLYPLPTTPAASRPGINQPPQRRRGPATTHDWHSICGEIARRCVDRKTGRVSVPENESALADAVLQWLSDQDLGQPADSEMPEAVKRICAALRTAQK
jgi:hypothetical protein